MVTSTDYLIIGAGPAGLQLGYFLDRAGRDYLILEAGPTAGTFFRTYPRHRQLISINKPHTGFDDPELDLRMDWNSLLSDRERLLFPRYTERYFPAADVMVRYLTEFAEALGLNIRYGTRAVRVSRGERFRVVDEHGGVYEAPLLIVATGPAKPYLPTIPGIETAEQYGTVTVDPQDFADQRVLIIGKGNSAFETADNLIETAAVIHLAGPTSIRMAWQSHYAGHLRAVNSNFLDTSALRSQNALLDGHILSIDRTAGGYLVTVRLSRAGEPVRAIRYDRVIACTGFRFDGSIFAEGCRPALVLDDRFPAQTSAWESVNVPDLYFAGTLMQARDFGRSTSGHIHGFRYCIRALHRILEERYHDIPWPPRGLPADAEALAVAVVCRASRTSALWQQFGRLCDVVVLEGAEAAYYEELPVDYVHDSRLGNSDSYFTITLEYGDGAEPFSDAAYLRPVVRHYRKSTLVAEHHVAGNLENDWTSPQTHRDPLREFFARQLDPDAGSCCTGMSSTSCSPSPSV
jgi:thioredoxin reductase